MLPPHSELRPRSPLWRRARPPTTPESARKVGAYWVVSAGHTREPTDAAWHGSTKAVVADKGLNGSYSRPTELHALCRGGRIN